MADQIIPASKLPGLETTIFTVMSQLAQKHNAINLSQGFPNFPVARELIDLVYKHMREGKNQYAPMRGVFALRETLAQKIKSLYNVSVDHDDEITITAGGTQALFASISALVHPGDEVIIFEPAYDSYGPAVKLMGGIPRFISLEHPSYRIPWDKVRAAMSARTKMLIINSPHNPTGTLLTPQDIKELKSICDEFDFYILSDEVYEHLIFEGKQHLSMLSDPQLRSRSICTFSFGKVFNNTGWKIGYFIAPPALTKEVRNVHQFEVFSVNHPVQYALSDFLQDESRYLDLSGFFQQKRDLFQDLLQESKWKLLPCEGTYFQLADYSAISGKGDVEFARELCETIGVATIPVSAFYANKEDHKVLRFCFAKDDETLKQAAAKLCQL